MDVVISNGEIDRSKNTLIIKIVQPTNGKFVELLVDLNRDVVNLDRSFLVVYERPVKMSKNTTVSKKKLGPITKEEVKKFNKEVDQLKGSLSEIFGPKKSEPPKPEIKQWS